jgi:hypothetical protein
MLWDDDESEARTIHPTELQWSSNKKDKGWQVVAITDRFDMDKDLDEEGNKDEWEAWSFGDGSELHFCIRKYYRKFPSDRVICFTKLECIKIDMEHDADYEDDVEKLPSQFKPSALCNDEDNSEDEDDNDDNSGNTRMDEDPHAPTDDEN